MSERRRRNGEIEAKRRNRSQTKEEEVQLLSDPKGDAAAHITPRSPSCFLVRSWPCVLQESRRCESEGE